MTDDEGRTEDREVLRPSMANWNFNERETTHRETANEKLPTLRLADISRRFLAAVSMELNERVSDDYEIAKMTAVQARQVACTHLGLVMVRSLGATITLLTHGYDLEASMPGRVVLESFVRAQQVEADSSGEVARRMLRGHGSGAKFKQAAQRFGFPIEVVEWLDRFAHPDLLTLDLLVNEDREISLKPQRGVGKPVTQLLVHAQTATAMATLICSVFEVDVMIPPYIDAQLRYYKDHPLNEPPH